jgi:hypothetical protein
MRKSSNKEEAEFTALSGYTNMKKKKILIILGLFLVLASLFAIYDKLKNGANYEFGWMATKDNMNELAKDGNYHYKNKDLGFSLALPAAFQYYQTQRIDKEDYVDLEIFIPTSDVDYIKDIAGYAKPVVIRVYKNKAAWEKLAADQEEAKLYQQLKSNGEKVYAIRYWSEAPNDWKEKWNDDIKNKIISGFKLY